ncbi:uncharacterized protein K444DRAFT_140718 [Hyaloscypha bicolor E]|uniref:HMG box domain-containing protein n=1 Tax=Hyaloscypha bicolor E TaxID=1095630 RepID=A0A2J6SU60_9HELO|nr:uncharacterized protein K444DRAFT_140718 [Hyaloscypha bicolor E]PMD54302.1 hypothetical protein K444DRAFT_140718 [Hyaloscypha bicolor E]
MATGGTVPTFIRDGSAPRVFLGPLPLFQQQQGFQLPAIGQFAQAVAPQLQGQAGAPQLQGQPVALPAQAHASAAGAGVATGPARAARRQADKIPRPPNAWILFRKHFHPSIVEAHPEFSNNEISTYLAAAWKAEPQAVIDYWHAKAAEAKAEHMRKYPDYQYKPRKSSDKKRRMSKKKEAALTATPKVALTAEAAPTTPITQGATVITVEPTYTITPMDNVDIIAEAKAFGQAMFNAGYDMTHGAGGFDGQSLFTEDGAAAEDEGAVAEYDDEHSNEFLDWIFS